MFGELHVGKRLTVRKCVARAYRKTVRKWTAKAQLRSGVSSHGLGPKLVQSACRAQTKLDEILLPSSAPKLRRSWSFGKFAKTGNLKHLWNFEEHELARPPAGTSRPASLSKSLAGQTFLLDFARSRKVGGLLPTLDRGLRLTERCQPRPRFRSRRISSSASCHIWHAGASARPDDLGELRSCGPWVCKGRSVQGSCNSRAPSISNFTKRPIQC